MSSDDRQAIITLRCTGQYRAALLALSANDSKHEKHIPEPFSILQRAQCHFALYQFAELSAAVAEFRKQPNCKGTKEEALIDLLDAYGRVHTGLQLQGAVQIADEIYAKWFADQNVEDFDEMDISLFCFHHTIKDLEQRLLFDSSKAKNIEPLWWRKMESLRERLLQKTWLNSLAMIHTAEAKTQPAAVQISRLQQTISLLAENAGAMRVHLVVLLAQALYKNGDFELALSELASIEALRMPSGGSERELWAEYLRLQKVSGSEGLGIVEDLRRRFEGQGNRHGVLLCHFRTAEIIISMNNKHQYRAELQKMLRDTESYSSLDFWLLYIEHFFQDDINDRSRLGIAIFFCVEFFNLHGECSIPQLKYTLAASLADCYEYLRDMHQVLHWRFRAKEIAEETDDQSIRDEAEYQVQMILADNSVKAADDPYGVKQPEWERTQREELEVKYWDAKSKGKYDYQYAYAFDLLQKELDDEIKSKEHPCGRIWLSKANEALELIPERKVKERPRITFALGHSLFVFGDLGGALETLTDAFEQATRAENDQIARMTLFTKSRAYLHQYLATRHSRTFESCRVTLQDSQDRCERDGKMDEVACCHVVGAVLWHSKGSSDSKALKTALHHISEAERLWNEERGELFTGLGLDGLTSRYSLRARNENNQYSILGLAVEICYQIKDFPEAWKWIEYAKARAFLDSLGTEHISLPKDGVLDTQIQSQELISTLDEPAVLVHWVFVGETIYMMTRRGETEFQMFRLDITASTVEEWYQGLITTQEDYRDPETAADLLSELVELCGPLSNSDCLRTDELLILCPTRTLFKIPLHAIPMDDGTTLLDRNPVMYTHSFGVSKHCLRRGSRNCSETPRPQFFGNPTDDTPAGEASVLALENQYRGESFVRSKATKGTFLSKSRDSKFVHFHGHVISALHPLSNVMLFHNREELKVREVFEMNLHRFNPFIALIACGSGVERLEVGDEPLGFISAFLYAGASTVLATLWPINDELSGAAFSNIFYGLDVNHKFNPKGVVDLSKRLRLAALSIKARPETAAPYFWAAFVMHGSWKVILNQSRFLAL